MRGVEIHDKDSKGGLAFDLKDILECLGENAAARQWRCSGVEATGDGSEELHAASDAGTDLDGRRLIDIASRVLQVIDGTLTGRRPDEAHDSLVLQAVDSTLWEVFGDDECLARIRDRFGDVRPAHYEAG